MNLSADYSFIPRILDTKALATAIAKEMPVVKDGKIVVRRIMNVSSSFDHRIVDGANGAALVQALKRMLEYPALIFM